MDDQKTQREEQTLGQSRVRTSFNPSEDSLVDKIKQMTANLIDLCGEHRLATTSETYRCYGLAMDHYEAAAMWAVKAATGAKK